MSESQQDTGSYSMEDRLVLAQTASCNCQTKTHEHAFHAWNCPYRVMQEAHEVILAKDVRIDGTTAEITRLQAELAEAKAKLDGALTLGHGCGWNAREILADRCEEKLKSDLSAARATIVNLEAHHAQDHDNAYTRVQSLEATIAKMRGTLDWITAPHTDLSHIVFRQEAKLRAEEACRVEPATLASPAEKGDDIIASTRPALENERARAAEKVRPDRYRHVKRGSFYTIVGESALQTDTPLTDMADLIVYRAEKDGTLWVRSKKEFYDGRFVLASPAEKEG